MNKAELVEMLARRLGMSQTELRPIVEAVFDTIREGVEKDGKVTISGFGSFRKKLRKARTGINPSTKQPIEIRACTTVSFSPSAQLKHDVEDGLQVAALGATPHL